MDPEMLKQLSLGVLPPGIAGLIAALILARPAGEAGSAPSAASRTTRRAVLAAPLMAIVYLATHWLMFGRPELPPVRSIDALPIAAGVAGLAGAVMSITRVAIAARLAVLTIGAAACAWLSVRGLLADWSGARIAAQLGSATTLIVLNTAGAAWLMQRTGPRTGIGAALIAVGGAAQVLVLGFFSLKLGQAAGAGAAALGGALLVLLVHRTAALAPAIVVVPVFVSMIALFQGVHYGEAARPLTLALLAASAIPAAMIGLVLTPAGARPVHRLLAVLVMTLVPLGAAIALALAARGAHEEGEAAGESISTNTQPGINSEVSSC